MKHRITIVTSAAGGTGKSFFAINSAIHQSKRNKKVLLIDFTLYGGLEVFVRQSNKYSGLGILYSQFEQDQPLNLKKAIIENHEVLGCDVLINTQAITMEKMNIEFVECLFQSLKMSDYDEIIVDTSMELSERNSKFIQLANQIIYLMTQDISVCWRTMKHIEILDKLQIDRSNIKLMMNRYKKDVVFNKREFEEESKTSILGVIPDYKSTIVNFHNEGKTLLSQSLNRHGNKLIKILNVVWS